MNRIRAATLIAAVVLAATVAAHAQTAAPLEVGWISRDPRIPPPIRRDAPREEGWPEPGQTVHWVAHVLNRGPQTAQGVPYVWRVNGEPAETGRVDLPPGETTVWLPWRWTFDRHEIVFALAAGDGNANDDRLAVTSDALSLGFWVERGLYDWMMEGDRPGFERWAQGEVEKWNRLLARAVYPTAPRGALDRIRLDRVTVAPEGGRPRNDEFDTDLHWFFFTTFGDQDFLQLGAPPRVVDDQAIVLHELLHQRGLTDLYAYDVVLGGPTDSRIDITDGARPVAGSPLMPPLIAGPIGSIVYRLPANGLMGTLYRATANLTEHCVNGLNLRAGRRTVLWVDQWGNLINGFANVPQPDNYLWRLSGRTDVLLRDQDGLAIAGASVDVYLDRSPDTYRKLYGPGADRTLTSDIRGGVALAGNLLDGMPPVEAPPKSQVIILGVRTPRARGFAFLPVYDLNLAYFRQSEEHAELELKVRMHPY